MIPGFIWRFPARVLRVIDGDTVALVDIDQGFKTCRPPEGQDERLRLLDLWCPELHTEAGKAAKAYAQSLLPVGVTVAISSHTWKPTLDRWLGRITLPDGRDFAEAMREAGHGTLTKLST